MAEFRSRVDHKGRISIPVLYRETEGIVPGDIVIVHVYVLKKKEGGK